MERIPYFSRQVFLDQAESDMAYSLYATCTRLPLQFHD
jgi:hypothetical protein